MLFLLIRCSLYSLLEYTFSIIVLAFSRSETDSKRGTTSTLNSFPNVSLIIVKTSKIFIEELLLLIIYL